MSRTGERAALVALLFCCAGAAVAQQERAPIPIAVFELELADTSGEPTGDLHDRRRQRTTEALRRALEDTGRYRSIDVEPAAARVARAGHLRTCNGCEVDIAKDLGARQALIGTVHKISTLILYVAVVITDVETREPVFVGTVSIRGDNDEAWERGVRYIVRNKLMRGNPATR